MDQAHLRIKAFYGTSENAVKTQIWIAVYGLRAGGHRPQAPGAEGEPLSNSTDSERDAFRENAHFTGTLQPSDSQDYLLDSANQLNLLELYTDSTY